MRSVAPIAAGLAVTAALFLTAAYAMRLTITSPYFTIRFGPQQQAAAVQPSATSEASPAASVTVAVATELAIDVAPTQPISLDEGGCLLGAVCVTAAATVAPAGGTPAAVPGLRVEVDEGGAAADVQPEATEAGVQIEALGVEIGIGPAGLDLNLP
jgi:hypothetical protein